MLAQIKCDDGLGVGHVFHHFDHGGTIVVLATRIGIDANIRRRQITDQSVSLDQPGKPHMLFEIQLARELDLEKRSEEHTSELQSRENLVCRLLLEKKKNNI